MTGGEIAGFDHVSEMDPRIRAETPDDVADIDAVTVAAFRDAPHSEHTEHLIVAALRRSGALSVSLVAEHDGAVVGHVAASPVSISDGSAGWYGLGPVSVHPELQRTGIGSRLIRAALQDLRERRAAGCVVLGDPAYYSRFGFVPVAGLSLPGVPAEYFQALSLGASIAHGQVRYHAAFDTAA
jgi:putative acetyltransferase